MTFLYIQCIACNNHGICTIWLRENKCTSHTKLVWSKSEKTLNTFDNRSSYPFICKLHGMFHGTNRQSFEPHPSVCVITIICLCQTSQTRGYKAYNYTLPRLVDTLRIFCGFQKSLSERQYLISIAITYQWLPTISVNGPRPPLLIVNGEKQSTFLIMIYLTWEHNH